MRNVEFDGLKIAAENTKCISSYITSLINNPSGNHVITFLNAYVYCLTRKNNVLYNIIKNSLVTVIDGFSISTGLFFLTGNFFSRSIMTKVFDLVITDPELKTCDAILIGIDDDEIKKSEIGIKKVSDRLNIVKTASGFLKMNDYVQILNQYKNVNLVIIGMSTPQSEMLCREASVILKNSVIWHVGAGTLKCYAGTKKRAPVWISNIGLEWMHRFIFEKHTRKRYLKYNFAYLFYLAGLIGKKITFKFKQ